MIPLRIEGVDEKIVRLTGIPALMANCLQCLGDILAQQDKPSVRQRLIPKSSNDETVNADWENIVVPDLRHLFVTATETVLRDLTAMAADPQHPSCFCVAFPAVHLDAWMSAINQTRLILGEQFHVTDRDMHQRNLDPSCAFDIALIRINLLGWLLEVLVKFSSGEPVE